MRSGGGRGGGWRRSWESRRLCDGCAPVDPGDFDSQTNKEFLQFCVLESTFCAMPLSVVETPPPRNVFANVSWHCIVSHAEDPREPGADKGGTGRGHRGKWHLDQDFLPHITLCPVPYLGHTPSCVKGGVGVRAPSYVALPVVQRTAYKTKKNLLSACSLFQV